MASKVVSGDPSDSFHGTMLQARPLTIWRLRDRILGPLASLKITVTLFAMAIFIILVGTLAQVSMDMWEVLDSHFQSWITWIDLQVFFPRSWFPQSQDIPGGFWFPGGASIGLAMVINLSAAHLVRFKIQARGARLAAGLGVFAAGASITALVIASGHNHTGLQGGAPIDWNGEPIDWTSIWLVAKLGLGATAMGSLVSAMLVPLSAESRKIEQLLLYAVAAVFGTLTLYLFMAGQSAYPGDAGMRILWQLMKGGLAGLVMLAGTMLLYKKRGGVALVHMGVALLMFGQFWVANYDVEEQISIGEGETASFAHDIRQVELAIIDSSDERRDEVVVIPQSCLQASAAGRRTSWLRGGSAVDKQGVIKHEFLPFDIQVLKYLKNSDMQAAEPSDENLATAGIGMKYLAVPVRASTGTDSDSRADMGATYVKFTGKDGSELGTHMVSQLVSSQGLIDHVDVGDKTYHVSLRFKRNHKPYSVTLLDASKDDYLGTSMARNFSSDVRLIDKERGTDREIHIWMNNPLRYAGETFYQSGYSGPPDFPTESTTLAVVTNSGWMIPYVACMVVGVGLMAHFLGVLLRFLKRRDSSETLMAWGTHAELAGGGLGILGLLSMLFVAARPREQAVSDPDSKNPDASRKRKKTKSGKVEEVYVPSLEAPKLIDAVGAVFPLLVVGLFAALFFTAARPQATLSRDLNLSHFGDLPLVADGRVKPFDTLARNSLRVISNRETFRGRKHAQLLKQEWPQIAVKLAAKWDGVSAGALTELAGDIDGTIDLIAEKSGKNRYRIEESVDKLTTERYPAIRWLLDVVSMSEAAQHHKVFRIDNLEVLDTLGLERRKSHLYSVDEILGGVAEFEKQVDLARQTDVEQLSTYQRKIVELDGRVRTYTRLAGSFKPPSLPPFPTAEEYQQDRAAAEQKIRRFQQERLNFIRGIDSIKPPLAVPEKDAEGSDKWECFAKAWTNALVKQLIGEETPPATEHLTVILASYQAGDARTFNDEVVKYRRWLHRNRPEQLRSKSTYVGRYIDRRFGSFFEFEAYFNRVSPFFFCWWPYLTAFALSALAWLGWSKPLNRASFWLIVFTVIVHTVALGARIYISGRPPVTNLYSSAVFIGWSVVLFGLTWELFYRNGIGNVVASALGFTSMVIAHNLAGDGDTFAVLVAVLDTQFWLATHVVTVTLGYATTFFAGFLGVTYILRGWLTRSLTRDTSKELSRMIYGTVCFSLFFSFVGTVLGGLWADDSWGRFWGWDPKENGALIIVLWNALVLHSRWGGLVKERGLAVLSVGGNIVTGWSWFGVNELGVGLHSYGFTQGVLLTLLTFAGSQAAIIGLGMLPKRLWTSFRAHGQA